MLGNALVIGRALPVIFPNARSEQPAINVGGSAALIAHALLGDNRIRPTLLTAVDPDTPSGRATRQLIAENGILYRAIPCENPTPFIELDPPGETSRPRAQPSITVEDLGHALRQTIDDYEHVIADCNLAVPVLEIIAGSANLFSLHGTATDRCVRIMSTQNRAKNLVCLDEAQALAMQQANSAKSNWELSQIIQAERMLVTYPRGKFELYEDHRLVAEGPPQKADPMCLDYGVSEAAMGGFIGAMSEEESNVVTSINEAVSARLKLNAQAQHL